MRISDWSSDVCSSDLVQPGQCVSRGARPRRDRLAFAGNAPGNTWHRRGRMSLLGDPATLGVLIVAVILLGMAKGGLAGVGALATPLAALVLPPAIAAAVLLPVLIVQDVVSVWAFRSTRNGWKIGRASCRERGGQ